MFPTLTDPFALEQSSLILLALDHAAARWDKAFRFCREENTALRPAQGEGATLLENEATVKTDCGNRNLAWSFCLGCVSPHFQIAPRFVWPFTHMGLALPADIFVMP